MTPNTKVRMSRSDVWKERPCVLRWRAFKDRVRELAITVQDGDDITFELPMPESWSAKKRAAYLGKPHRAKPDLDNLLGGLFDAAMPKSDAHIAELSGMRKRWGEVGCILIDRRQSP